MAVDDQEVWDFFASDAAEAIRLIEESLLELEADPGNADQINRLYRGLHTLKGNSGFLELKSVERTAHACEDLVGLVRDRGLALDTAMVNLILEALDLLRWAVEEVANQRRDVPAESVADLVERVHDVYVARGGGAKTKDAAVLGEIFGEDTFTGPDEEPVSLAEPSDPVPSLAFDAAPARSTPAAESGDVASAVATPGTAEPVPDLQAKAEAPRVPAKASKDAAKDKGKAREDDRSEFLRIDAAKVASLMDLAGELGLACSAVTRHEDVVGRDLEGFAAAAHKLELLVREIQTDLSSLRLVPVASVFTRMKRVVRDAAQRTGKKIDFVIQGEETEVDKVMLDAIQDPLVHVLRNAVDHGIEVAEGRAAAGKGEAGRITLSASHQGGEVTIEVRDDGRGLDRERILARAKERGLCPEHATPTDEEIVQFVFLPGFSTKEVADTLSGRGVGMDVLKTTIENLRGRVRLKSVAGQGSCIVMTMPLTLAFVEAMVVREQDRLFALPIEKVFEVSRVAKEQVVRNTADGQTMLRVHDTCVPVLWLHKYWGEDHAANETLADRVVVVVQTARGALALPVDELIGNQQVMLKPLRGLLSNIRAAAGCGMLRTGDVAVALDCERLSA